MQDPDVFSIQTSTEGAVLVLAVGGEIDLTTAPELGKAIELVSDHTSAVVVDLTRVTFLDSSGINALLAGKRGLSENRVGFRVVATPGSPVRRILEITQLTESLGVMASLEEALAAS